MIQVCSRCGTRWNVREQQRGWCPRCHGALLAPSAVPVPGPPPPAAARQPVTAAGAKRRPAGFRWIAVRPGPPPPPRRRRSPLGPTPRYQSIPRWGLIDRIGPAAPAVADRTAGPSASPTVVRATVMATAAVFALGALAHAFRYILLLVNRTTLLPPLVANGTLLMGVLVSLAAIAAVIATAAVMTSWLIARRAEVFGRHGQPDPRPEWALWVGCLAPVVNLVWAPVFVIELARAERSDHRLRGPITAWWIAWIVSTLISAWAMWTSSATEPQAIADNTVTVIVGYLAGLATLLLLLRVFDGFERRPVQRPLHRWVVVGGAPAESEESVPGSESDSETDNESAIESDIESDIDVDVESRDREPAA